MSKAYLGAVRVPLIPSKLLRIAIIIIILYIYGIGAIFGLATFKYDKSSGKNKINPILQIWCIFVTICLIVLYPYVALQLEVDKRINFSLSSTEGLLSAAQVLMKYISLILVYIMNFVRGNDSKNIMNGNLELQDIAVNYMTNQSEKLMWSLVIQFYRKVFILTVLALIFGFLYTRELNNIYDTSSIGYSCFIFFYPYCIQTFIANIFYLGLLRTQVYIKTINQIIEKITQEMKDIGTLSRFHKIRKICEKSDILDDLCAFHFKVCDMMKKLNSVYAAQMLIFVAIVFLNSLAQLFYLYMTIKMNLKEQYKANWSISVYSIMYAYFQYVDLFFHAKSSMETMHENLRTGRLLHSIPSVHIDGRLKKSV
uniref:Gustatory receptor n=1 Tax=Phlebotomus papatasi TaxID=29031 RepID=A0A8W9BF62_PHLPP